MQYRIKAGWENSTSGGGNAAAEKFFQMEKEEKTSALPVSMDGRDGASMGGSMVDDVSV